MYFCMRHYNYNIHLNWSLLQVSFISSAACISNYCCYWCFLWAGIWRKCEQQPGHCWTTTSGTGTSDLTISFLCGIWRQRELACRGWSRNARWITSCSMNANQHVCYNTSVPACHISICGVQLAYTSVWCRNAQELQKSWMKGFAQWNTH